MHLIRQIMVVDDSIVGEFLEFTAENDADGDAPIVNVGTGTQNGSDSNQQKCLVPSRINRISVTAMSRSEALRTLNYFAGSRAAKSRSNCKILDHKHHSDKWCDRCVFARKESEDVFKKTSTFSCGDFF